MSVVTFPDPFQDMVHRAITVQDEGIARCFKEGGSEQAIVYAGLGVVDLARLLMNIHNNDATQVALEIIERIQVVTGVVQLAPAPGGVPFLHELPEGCDRILVCGHVFMRAA